MYHSKPLIVCLIYMLEHSFTYRNSTAKIKVMAGSMLLMAHENVGDVYFNPI